MSRDSSAYEPSKVRLDAATTGSHMTAPEWQWLT
jgi:hypothetical protein